MERNAPRDAKRQRQRLAGQKKPGAVSAQRDIVARGEHAAVKITLAGHNLDAPLDDLPTGKQKEDSGLCHPGEVSGQHGCQGASAIGGLPGGRSAGKQGSAGATASATRAVVIVERGICVAPCSVALKEGVSVLSRLSHLSEDAQEALPVRHALVPSGQRA